MRHSGVLKRTPTLEHQVESRPGPPHPPRATTWSVVSLPLSIYVPTYLPTYNLETITKRHFLD